VIADRTMIETDNDTIERLLAVKMALDIAVSAYVLWAVFDMMNRGKVSYVIRWHYQQWKRRREDDMRRSRDWHLTLGRMLFEAERIVREPSK
jgi:DNA-binding transcriptional MocR family regulator